MTTHRPPLFRIPNEYLRHRTARILVAVFIGLCLYAVAVYIIFGGVHYRDHLLGGLGGFLVGILSSAGYGATTNRTKAYKVDETGIAAADLLGRNTNAWTDLNYVARWNDVAGSQVQKDDWNRQPRYRFSVGSKDHSKRVTLIILRQDSNLFESALREHSLIITQSSASTSHAGGSV